MLAASESDPQTRDRRWSFGGWGGETADRVRPDSGDIADYVDDYEECPLVSTPIDNFAKDVLAPGIRFEGEADGLADDLETFAETCAIVGGEYDHSWEMLAEDQVRDDVLRGDGLAEVAYEDREVKSQIKGFRLFRKETVTAYTQPGTNILLRPDDDRVERTVNGATRTVPLTAAGETAAYVQFDDVFSTSERDEVALALPDVVKISNRPDTGDVFGRSVVAPVHARIEGLLKKLDDVDEAIHAKAYKFWLIKFGPDEDPWPEQKAADFMAEHTKENYGPGKKQGVPGDVSIDTVEGEVPEVWESFSFDVQYILSSLPTPKYRTGFEDNINRDVALRQQEDYQDLVRRERRKLEAAWTPIWERVAVQLGYESPDLTFKIEEPEETNPLRSEWFDAGEFKNFMQGVKAAAPGGAVDTVLPPETVIEIAGMDPEEVRDAMPDDADVDEANEQVQQFMRDVAESEATAD